MSLTTLRLTRGAFALIRAILGSGHLRLALEAAVPYTPVPALPAPFLPALALLWAVTAASFLLGACPVASGIAFALCSGYVLLMDVRTYSNNLYCLGLVVLLVALAHRTPVAITLPRCHVSLVYGFVALAKLTSTYLSGATLVAFTFPALHHPVLVTVGVLGSIAGQAFVAVSLWTRWRWAGAVVGVLLHVAMLVTFDVPWADRLQIALFGASLVVLYPLFWHRIGRLVCEMADVPVPSAQRRRRHRRLPSA